ncbi:MAG TPA: hypothetical protein VHB77_13770 [Planctomycetaceae bacterium]|nr:hypothetical protein [Planctomycetaceae bacterium]
MDSVEGRTNSLVQSLVIDALGMATYLLPFVGEEFDLMIAPVLAIWIWRLHGSWVAGSIGFFEEVLPFTDIFPTATATWCYRYLLRGQPASSTTGTETTDALKSVGADSSRRIVEPESCP